eukprot:3297466-Pleurochrysis_carterae.AAC.1
MPESSNTENFRMGSTIESPPLSMKLKMTETVLPSPVRPPSASAPSTCSPREMMDARGKCVPTYADA